MHSSYQCFLQEEHDLGSGDGAELSAVELAHLPATEVLDDDGLCPHAPLVVDHRSVQTTRLRKHLRVFAATT